MTFTELKKDPRIYEIVNLSKGEATDEDGESYKYEIWLNDGWVFDDETHSNKFMTVKEINESLRNEVRTEKVRMINTVDDGGNELLYLYLSNSGITYIGKPPKNGMVLARAALYNGNSNKIQRGEKLFIRDFQINYHEKEIKFKLIEK